MLTTGDRNQVKEAMLLFVLLKTGPDVGTRASHATVGFRGLRSCNQRLSKSWHSDRGHHCYCSRSYLAW